MSGRRAQSLLACAREFREEVRQRMQRRDGPLAGPAASLSDVRKVALILSAPRSGSSLLQSLLKTLPEVYSLSGECVPFYKLNGLASDADASDVLPASAGSRSQRLALGRDFLGDFSMPEDATSDPLWKERYLDDIALRLPLQWPQVPFSYSAVRKAAGDALATHLAAAPRFCKEGFYLELLARLRQRYPAIDPYYYDIPARLVAARFPRLRIPAGPPNDTFLIEEPPFILLEPRRRAGAAALRSQTLLLKSTVNCYRLGLIRSLFPNAKVRVLYLTRHPLASINGLCDGWLHRGFFSRNMRARLRRGLAIAGYSDQHPWGKWWWNFDLPPGWEEFAASRLESVCAFQWMSANRQVQKVLRATALPALRIRFEDITGGLASRKKSLMSICRFLDLDFTGFHGPLLKAPPVIQATQPPGPWRWMQKRAALLPLLRDRRLQKVSSATGYGEPGRFILQ